MNSRNFHESLRYAFNGLKYCISTQRNMKIHMIFAAAALLAGMLLRISRLELAVVIISISMVLACEIINTAVEKAVDTATQKYDPLAKIAKDVAAGAVLAAAAGSVIVGCLIFGRYLLNIVLKI